MQMHADIFVASFICHNRDDINVTMTVHPIGRRFWVIQRELQKAHCKFVVAVHYVIRLKYAVVNKSVG